MATNQNSASDVIKRSAIDSAGRLGSLYDGYRDCVLGQLDVKNIERLYQSDKSEKCQIIKGDVKKKSHPLQLVDIEKELQLSIILNLAPKTGIASLMDYSRPISEFTRILYFHYVNSEEQFPDKMSESQQPIQSFLSQTSATHIITGVSWGFYVIVILQLPFEEETVCKIDGALDKIRIILENGQGHVKLDTDDENLLRTICPIEIRSNVPELARMTTWGDVCCNIDQFKTHGTINYPMMYTLRPITWLYPEDKGQSVTFVLLPPAMVDTIQKHVFQILFKMKDLEIFVNNNLPKVLCKYLKEQLYDVHQQWWNINKKYRDEIDRLSKLLIDCRNGQLDVAKIKEALDHPNHLTLAKNMNDLMQNLKSLEEKGQFITDLQQFKYCNASERDIDETDSNKTIERKLIIDQQCDRVICTNDFLNKNNPEQLNQLRFKLIKEYEENSFLRLIYADFSYTSFPLNDMMLLPLTKIDDHQSQPKQKVNHSSIIVQSPSTPTEIINILLLGETGVGKSTFINALINYLTFDSLQTAETNQPIILIPVSFVITVGDNFTEHVVEFDGSHKSNNENFNSFGQSVTQHCRSYIFQLKNNDGKKLRIIDTPGFGDTRGSEQDDWNMQHILEYTNSLTHLNAICFLLKPDNARLNVLFRSCFVQLLDYLGPNAGENIIFCFTNTRATFFAPGNTAPLLKTMLNSLSNGTIPFQKDNTFCFDSESFRYLAALKKKVSFNDSDKSEYEHSWSMSVKESNRLMDCICKRLPTQRMQSEQQSIKHVQFEIIHMIRPMLEAIRNILRNINLFMSNSLKNSIELRPRTLYRIATQCRSCKLIPVHTGNFWIIPELGHEIHDKCLTCPCSAEQHSPTEYILHYECSTNIYNLNELNNMLPPLFDASVEFAYFIMHVTRSTKDDPFLAGFNRMIEEEKNISEQVQRNELNLQLVQQLENIVRDYKEKMDKIGPNQWDKDLSFINDRIKTIIEYPMVREQMTAIKQGREIMMNHHEFEC